MNRKAVLRIMLTCPLIAVLTLAFNIQYPEAEAIESPAKAEPSVEYIDFHNGTVLMIEDYGNGTQDYTIETFIKKTAELQVDNSEANQLSSIGLPTSSEESTDYIIATEQAVMEQEIIMGFTYEIAKLRRELVNVEGRIFWIVKWYVKAGINVDIEFGLRLPVNITIEYPEQMTVGNNYTLYATLTPTDKPDYDEFLFIFQTYIWAEVGVTGLGKWRASLGPNYDYSKSFQTPLGPEAEIPVLPIEVDLWDVGINFWLWNLVSFLKVKLVIEPAFGSEKITAKASATGDSLVVENANIEWSAPDQRRNFTVHADDYDPTTSYAGIQLSDFRYYFTKFKLYIKILFDFHDVVNNLIGEDPELTIATLDMSWLLKLFGEPYLRDGVLSISIYVEKLIPPPQWMVPINVNPDVLNLRSKGKWLTAYIEPPEGYNVSDIDVSTIMLNGTIPAELHPVGIGDEDGDSIPDLMVKFSRAEVVQYILDNVDIEFSVKTWMTPYGLMVMTMPSRVEVKLTITGKLNDGTPFQGSDTIRIIMPMPRGSRRHMFPIPI